METELRLRKNIAEIVRNYVDEYQSIHEIDDWWGKPLVGFGDAKASYFKELKHVVSGVHKQPDDFMETPNTVIAYFIPFTEKLEYSNRKQDCLPSKLWVNAYSITNQMMAELNEFLVEAIGLIRI